MINPTNSETKCHLENTGKDIRTGSADSEASFTTNLRSDFLKDKELKRTHLPEVGHGGGQRSLGGNVRGVPGVVVHLRGESTGRARGQVGNTIPWGPRGARRRPGRPQRGRPAAPPAHPDSGTPAPHPPALTWGPLLPPPSLPDSGTSVPPPCLLVLFETMLCTFIWTSDKIKIFGHSGQYYMYHNFINISSELWMEYANFIWVRFNFRVC